MNILQVVLAYYPATAYGGPVRSVRNLCAGLEKLGHKCTVCTTNSDGVRIIDVECGRPVPVDTSTVWYFNSPRLHYYGYSPEMEKWLYSNVGNFDIVHINGIWNFPQRYAAKAARRSSIPYVVSPRGSADSRLVKMYRPVLKWLYVNVLDRINLQGASSIHYTTRMEEKCSIMKSVCRSAFIVPNASEFVVSDGAERGMLPPGVLSGEYILFTGRIAWKKQIDVIIKAFGRIAARYPGVKLVIAGPDDEGLADGLKKIARDEGIAGRVLFVGVLEGENLYTIYQNAKAFVSASLSENFGHTLVEAMVTGIPAIASENIDLTTLEAVKKICCVCQPNIGSVEKSLIAVLDNYGDWVERARNGVDVIKNLFSPLVVAEKVAEEYKRIITHEEETRNKK